MTYLGIEFPLFIIAVIANISLVIIVVRYAERNVSRILFLLFVISQVLWIVVNYLSFQITGSAYLWWSRATLFTAALHAFFFFLFIHVFLAKQQVLAKKLVVPLTSFLVLVAGLTLSPFIFTSLTVNAAGKSTPEVGPAMLLFGVFVAVCIVGAFVSLVSKYRRSQGMERAQWRYLAIGLSMTFFLVLTFSFVNFVFLKDLSTVRFGHLYTLPFLVFTAYAMAKHSLFNIKVIAAEIAVVILNLIALIQLLNSRSVDELIVNLPVFLGLLIVGVLLIRGVIKEVKQREQLQLLSDKLATANHELSDLNRFKTQLLSLASHQIKAPLATIKGFASILIEGLYGPIGDKPKETIRKMKDAADDLINLINTFLDMRKVEEGKMDYQFARVDIVSLVRKVVDELRPLTTGKDLKLEVTAPWSEVFVTADATKLKQVIQNLVDNAIKYTPAGRVHIVVDPDDGNEVKVTVADVGLGIPAELLPHLFEEFIRDERVKKAIRGTGLGLYIARKITEAHGGDLWAESAGEGQGCRFIATLKKVA